MTADARRALDLDHDQDVVVGVGGIPIAPEGFGLVSARAATTPGLGVRVVPITDRILGKQDRVAGLLDRLDHRHDDAQCAGIAGFQDVADVRGRYTHERDAPRFGDHLDQLLRFTPGQRAVLHFDPDEILAFAGFLRGFEVGMDDRVAEDLLAGLEFRDHGVEGKRTRLRDHILLLLWGCCTQSSRWQVGRPAARNVPESSAANSPCDFAAAPSA